MFWGLPKNILPGSELLLPCIYCTTRHTHKKHEETHSHVSIIKQLSLGRAEALLSVVYIFELHNLRAPAKCKKSTTGYSNMEIS